MIKITNMPNAKLEKVLVLIMLLFFWLHDSNTTYVNAHDAKPVYAVSGKSIKSKDNK